MKESDIRNDEVFAEYLRLSREDARMILRSSNQFVAIDCPACESSKGWSAFQKDGFVYRECADCRSLFVSPRPSQAMLDEFYGRSLSSQYWAEVFWPNVAEGRLQHVINPRVARILEHPDLARLDGRFTAVDVGAGAGGFLTALLDAAPHVRTIAVEPDSALAAQARENGHEVVVSASEEVGAWNAAGDFVSTFEVIEHVFDPFAFVASLAKFCRPGGTILVTGLGGDGFDVRMLGAASKSVSVPHHLNFLSVRGLERMFDRAGYVNAVVETPGQLDVELVIKGMRDASDLQIPPFIRTLLEDRDAETLTRFQEFLQASRLSSHTWIWAQCP